MAVVSGWLVRVMDRVVYGIGKHWLAFFNTVLALYMALPLAAPVFMQIGWHQPAQAIYYAYRPLCHQLPERSFFLFGERNAYSLDTLQHNGLRPHIPRYQRRYFIGNAHLGYKVAFCQRDLAIYSSALLAGLLYALTKRHWPKLPFRFYLLAILPMAIDGTGQLFGLWESSWLSRVVTGTLFGVASVWLLYPYIGESMALLVAETEAKWRRERESHHPATT